MSFLEFALSALIAFMVFLAFALTITAILLGSKRSKAEAASLFRFVVKKVFRHLPC